MIGSCMPSYGCAITVPTLTDRRLKRHYYPRYHYEAVPAAHVTITRTGISYVLELRLSRGTGRLLHAGCWLTLLGKVVALRNPTVARRMYGSNHLRDNRVPVRELPPHTDIGSMLEGLMQLGAISNGLQLHTSRRLPPATHE